MASDLQGWRLVDRGVQFGPTSDQGLATVTDPGGRRRVVYRGSRSIPASLKAEGWGHIGDPDGHGPMLFDCYQTSTGAAAKLFTVTTPDGAVQRYPHQLVDGEQFNNSFAAVSPSGQWLVSGEWGAMSRFLVFPAPVLHDPAPAPEKDLPLASRITFDRPVRDVQGAVFVDDTTLLSSTNDPQTDLWPVARQLLSIRLAAPLSGADVAGEVTCLGGLPLHSVCGPLQRFSAFEVEGIDYDRVAGDLRVAIVPPSPCSVLTSILRFRRG